MQYTFADWLQTRYRYDAEARNALVEAACVRYCKSKIVDVGAGTGANWAYYFNRFGPVQDWTLIDLDADLLRLARERVFHVARTGGYTIEEEPDSVRVSKSGFTMQVRFIHGSLFDLPTLVDLSEVNLITANAVFDLFSYAQFSDWLNQLFSYTGALLLTINYTGMLWGEASGLDAAFVELYNAHMKRPQAFGRAMGPDCGAGIRRTLNEQGWKTIEGESPWHVGTGDVELQMYLLDFMADSIPELELSAGQLRRFDQWLASKRKQVQSGRSSLTVEHMDFFAGRQG